MTNKELSKIFRQLSTPLVTDACIRNNFPVRTAPPGIQSLLPECKIAGAAICVQHFGSVDIFIEVIHRANPGDILVIDNQGRKDEGCIGDLTVLESKTSKLQGIVLWGTHRDTSELKRIGLPIYDYGRFPLSPKRLDKRSADALEIAHFGEVTVTSLDVVFADEDGIAFIERKYLQRVLETANTIAIREKQQAASLRKGITLYNQLSFERFKIEQENRPSLTFREFLRSTGGAIEE